MANTIKKSNKIWVDGNTLVKIDGEKMVDFELNGNGYSAKLKAFIAKRDKALEEASKAKTIKKVVEAEPGME